MKTRTSIVVSLAAFASLAGTASAQCVLASKYWASDALDSDRFGRAIAATTVAGESRMVVGAPLDDMGVTADTGSMYMYGKSGGGWSFLSKINPPFPTANGYFGSAVSMSDPFMIVGEQGYNGTGRAYVYERSGSNWVHWRTLESSFGQGNTQAGAAVAISAFNGGSAIVGAPNYDFHGETDGGGAFIYQRDAAGNWNYVLGIEGGDFAGDTNDHRGTSVAMSPNSGVAASGIPDREEDGMPADHGSVDIYRILPNMNWTHDGIVQPTTKEAGAKFGHSVAVYGSFVAVGAPYQNTQGGIVDAGSVTIFESTAPSTWVPVAHLHASDASTSALFGWNVTMEQGRVVVTAKNVNRAYVFDRMPSGVWAQSSVVSNPGGSNAFAQWGVAGIGGDVIVGDADNDAGSHINNGAIYVSQRPVGQNSDTCESAIEIATGTEATNRTGCTLNALPTGYSVGGCGIGGGSGPDVWYTWTPSCDGNVIIDTFGSTYDTVLTVHAGCPTVADSRVIACNDDGFASPERDSLVTFDVTAGQTYTIRVAGYNGASGSYVLRVVPIYGVSNDTCATATTVAEGQYPYSTCAATPSSFGTICAGAGGRDVWYRFIAPESSTYRFSTCGANYDTLLALYEGTQFDCPANVLDQLICADDSNEVCHTGLSLQSVLDYDLTAGQSYLVRVGGFQASSFGSGVLNIERLGCTVTCDFNQDGGGDTSDVLDLADAIAAGTDPFPASCKDFNQDGGADTSDVIELADAIASADCP